MTHLIQNWGDTGQPLEKLDYVPRDESWLRSTYTAGALESRFGISSFCSASGARSIGGRPWVELLEPIGQT